MFVLLQNVVVNAQFDLCAGIATIYARYKFVEKLNEETRVVRPCLNKTALVVGMISCLGMCIVATFQVQYVSTCSAHFNRIGNI